MEWAIIKIPREDIVMIPDGVNYDLLRVYVEDDFFKDDEIFLHLYRQKKKAESELLKYEQAKRHNYK